LGVYNNDKKIYDEVHNSSENESDFEKRFFKHENTDILENSACEKNKIKNMQNNSKNYDAGYYFEDKNYKQENNAFSNNYRLDISNKDENLKIKTKKKLNKLSKTHKVSKECIENIKSESLADFIKEDMKSDCAVDKSPLKDSIKQDNIKNQKQKHAEEMQNSTFANEENKTFDRIEFFKKLRNDSIKENDNVKKEDSGNHPNELILQNSQTYFNTKSNINNTNDPMNSKVLNFSDMGSKLKSNVSLTFNPNNSNKSGYNNTLSQSNTNLFYNNCGMINPSATYIFNLSNGPNNGSNYVNKNNTNSYSNKKEPDVNYSNSNIIEKQVILGYTNELINKINSNQLVSNSHSSRDSQKKEIQKTNYKDSKELNFEREFSFKKNPNGEIIINENTSNTDNDIKEKINSAAHINKTFQTVSKSIAINDPNLIKNEEIIYITPSASSKNKNCNSNNTPKKVKRIPFVKITPERIQREKVNISKSQISIAKNTVNLTESPGLLSNQQEKQKMSSITNFDNQKNSIKTEKHSTTINGTEESDIKIEKNNEEENRSILNNKVESKETHLISISSKLK
jgi:hypothetical protein